MKLSDDTAKVVDAFDKQTEWVSCREVQQAIYSGLDSSDPSDIAKPELAELLALSTRPKELTQDLIDHLSKIKRLDSDVIEHWKERAKNTKHPVLRSRFADMAWVASQMLLKTSAGIEIAQIAIDGYTEALAMDDGDGLYDNIYNVSRLVELSSLIGDQVRLTRSVAAVIEYSDKSRDDEKPGTYVYLYDLLIAPKKPPRLEEGQMKSIIEHLESVFQTRVDVNGPWAVEPHSATSIGKRLAQYYSRVKQNDKAKAVMRSLGLVFEQRSELGGPMDRAMFLPEAIEYYRAAGDNDDAERVTRLIEEESPKLKGEMSEISASVEISDDDRLNYLNWLIENGPDDGFWKWVVSHIPKQKTIQKQRESVATQFPITDLFPPVLISHMGTRADIGNTKNDPDGRAAYDTANYMDLVAPVFMSWGLDHLTENGLNLDTTVDLLKQSPGIDKDRLGLIRSGIKSFFDTNYIAAIHILVPQIEYSIVRLAQLSGGTMLREIRGGRSDLQVKSLNMVLNEERVAGLLGEDIRMYFIASLSHPKGKNLRNLVAHGLLSSQGFTKQTAERLLHVLGTIALMRHKGPEKPDIL